MVPTTSAVTARGFSSVIYNWIRGYAAASDETNGTVCESVRLISVVDMIPFSTFGFGQALVDFTRFRSQLSDICDVPEQKNSAPTADFLQIANEALLGIYREARSAGLEDIADTAQTIADLATITHLTWNYGQLFGEVRQLWQSLEKSLSKMKAFIVPAEKAKYINATVLFGEQVAAAFPNTLDHIKAAGECLAMDLNTAAVYHLMCVMERGMDAIAADLGIITKYKMWERKIEKMAEVITDFLRMDYNKSPLQGRLDFYKIATERLTAVQHATRNKTMHAESWYDEEQAEDIFRATRGFIVALADTLSAVEL